MADGGFSPDGGQILAPDGSVTYEFAGHVKATGLDLPAYTTRTGIPENQQATQDQAKVKWIRQTDGALIASLVASDAGELDLTVKGDPPNPSLGLYFGAVVASASNTNTIAGDEERRVIVRDDGFSSFAQIVEQATYTNMLDYDLFVPVTTGLYAVHVNLTGANAAASAFYLVGVPAETNLSYQVLELARSNYSATATDAFVTDAFGLADPAPYSLQPSAEALGIVVSWRTAGVHCTLRHSVTQLSAQYTF